MRRHRKPFIAPSIMLPIIFLTGCRLPIPPGFQVSTPSLSPSSGSYSSPLTVTVDCTTFGAEVRYTTDGSVPTESSNLAATSIVLNGSATLRVRGFLLGLHPSGTAEASYALSATAA